jgi:hypothetical protein
VSGLYLLLQDNGLITRYSTPLSVHRSLTYSKNTADTCNRHAGVYMELLTLHYGLVLVLSMA